ncbi:MAG: right-handed parallel beta-helix repeat-containing protein [Spirochaetales bacterium]|nr:right-handed parallel beta-helix repeat-containing protein [Spirochaetales bacterium]
MMKKLIIIIAILCALVYACDMVPDAAPGHTNPDDPDNPDYSGPEYPEAELQNPPPAQSGLDHYSLVVTGNGIEAYRYRLDDGDYSEETPVTEPIVLTGLDAGEHTIYLLGKIGDIWQWESHVYSYTWNIDFSLVTAYIVNEPAAYTRTTSFSLTVAGEDVASYRYSLNGTSYGAETDISVPITLNSLPDNSYALAVIGRHTEGTWQEEADASVYSWTVDTQPPTSTSISSVVYEGISDDITVTMSNTSDSEYYIVLRNTSPVTQVPVDGTSYSAGDTISGAAVVYSGSAAYFTDQNLPEGRYYYRAFAYDLARNYSSASNQLDTAAFDDKVYVWGTYTGTSLGLSTMPFTDLQAAITFAQTNFSECMIYIADGTYNSDSTYNLTTGISLAGGYSTDFTVTDYLGTALNNTNTASDTIVVSLDGVTGSSLVGITVTSVNNTGLDRNTTGIRIANCSDILLNELNVNTGDAYYESYGCYIVNSEVTIENTWITSGSSLNYTYGIFATGAATNLQVLDGSYIKADDAGTVNGRIARAVYLTNNANAMISGSDITTGLSTREVYGIQSNGGGNLTVSDCVVDDSAYYTRFGIAITDIDTAYAVLISNNTLQADRGASLNRSINIQNSSAWISGNKIQSEGGSTAAGVYLYDCSTSDSNSVTIVNNFFDMGTTTTTRGITSDYSTMYVRNNSFLYRNTTTLTSGAVYAIYMNNINNEHIAIDNNIFNTRSEGVGTITYHCAIWEASLMEGFLSKYVRNNCFGGYDYVYRFMYDPGVGAIQISITDPDGIPHRTGLPEYSSDNFNEWTHMVDATGVLDSLSPLGRVQGLDGGPDAYDFGYTTDKDGIGRTGNGSTGWSVGAYEYD